MVVDRDEKIAGIHQFADDAMNCLKEVLQILGRARKLSYAIKRRLQELRAFALCDVGIDFNPAGYFSRFVLDRIRA